MPCLRRLLPLALIALCAGCSDDAAADGPPGHTDAEGDLTLEQPGDVDAAEARARAPHVTLLREQGRYRCEISAAHRPAFAWAELRHGAGRSLRWEREGEPDATCTFELPEDLSGRLVARIGYGDGQTWRVALDL